MTKFILRRIVRGLTALFLFQSLLFALIYALPYDFSAFIIGGGPTLRQLIQRQLGLDQSFAEQYFGWLWDFLRLDLGESFLYWPTPVSTVIFNRLPRTLLLFLPAVVIAYLLGIWLGKVIAWHRGGVLEFGVTLVAIASYTSFAPWLAFLIVNIFGWHLGWLPYRRLVDHNIWFNAPVTVDWLLSHLVATAVLAGGAVLLVWRITHRHVRPGPARWALRLGTVALSSATAWAWWVQSGMGYLAQDVLSHLTLPLLTVVLLSFGETMMMMRTSMLETMSEDYVLMARAKGLPEKRIRDHHAARNAILPVITRLALNLPFVLVGSLVIELVFQWHAMGKVIFDAIEWQDIPVLMGILSVVGMLAVLAHVVLDILYVYLDPRLRYVERGA
ncbi:MAG TPA: ABC transporter permease [Chloroflexi bacterium]|nr:ABC transporter permease [Chloroflexota bacterium]